LHTVLAMTIKSSELDPGRAIWFWTDRGRTLQSNWWSVDRTFKEYGAPGDGVESSIIFSQMIVETGQSLKNA
jgi:hypothetical protein